MGTSFWRETAVHLGVVAVVVVVVMNIVTIELQSILDLVVVVVMKIVCFINIYKSIRVP